MTSLPVRKDDSDYEIISEVPSSEAGFMPSGGGRLNPYYQDAEQANLAEQTVPPKPNDNCDTVVFPQQSEADFNCLSCCCSYTRDEIPSNSLEGMPRNREPCSVTTPRHMRKFFSSIVVYVYVSMMTFVLVLLLLAELLLDLNIILVPDSSASLTALENSSSSLTLTPRSNQQDVIFILHWTNFSLLSLFLVEILLRFYAWRLEFVKSIAAVWDSAAVTVAFVVNLVTTIAAGYSSPFNAISLVVVFRFVRIFSLLKSVATHVKSEYEQKLATSESHVAELQINNQRLQRQITEKDYEIRQLRAHLGGLDSYEQEKLEADLNKRKNADQRYRSELEKALELSKREYEETNGSYVNKAFSEKPPTERVFVPEITVHHRENSVRREKYGKPSTSKAPDMPDAGDGETSSLKQRGLAEERTNQAMSHGELHGAETDNQTTDTQQLLDDGGPMPNDHWTVGYCVIVQSDCPLKESAFDTAKVLTGKNEKLKGISDVTEDEGIDTDTSTACDDAQTNLHRRSHSAALSSGTETSAWDQACASTSSLYCESGYLSDDRCHSTFSSPNRKSLKEVDPSGTEEEVILRVEDADCSRSLSSIARRTSSSSSHAENLQLDQLQQSDDEKVENSLDDEAL